MSNNSVPSELTVVLQTMIKPNYPNANVDNYYDQTTLALKVPATGVPDRLLQVITELILNSRSPVLYGYNVPMTDPERLDFYTDLRDGFTALQTVIAAVKAPITAKVVELTP